VCVLPYSTICLQKNNGVFFELKTINRFTWCRRRIWKPGKWLGMRQMKLLSVNLSLQTTERKYLYQEYAAILINSVETPIMLLIIVLDLLEKHHEE
jgi:hypothetical protein